MEVLSSLSKSDSIYDACCNKLSVPQQALGGLTIPTLNSSILIKTSLLWLRRSDNVVFSLLYYVHDYTKLPSPHCDFCLWLELYFTSPAVCKHSSGCGFFFLLFFSLPLMMCLNFYDMGIFFWGGWWWWLEMRAISWLGWQLGFCSWPLERIRTLLHWQAVSWDPPAAEELHNPTCHGSLRCMLGINSYTTLASMKKTTFWPPV